MFDPIFLDIPVFLRIMCVFDTFVNGPFYLATFLTFYNNLQLSIFRNTDRKKKWWWFYSRIMCPLSSGALIYSTLVYFGYEVWEEWYVLGRNDLLWVFIINGPWTVAPIWLLWRVGNIVRVEDRGKVMKKAVQGKTKSGKRK
tara:strand:+ start:37 stop:462 length:426 start_codon:yes stop_codon:yes gene_type:complete